MKTRILQLGREALAYCQCASALISGNKALSVSVDLIGEKNQVILELYIFQVYMFISFTASCRNPIRCALSEHSVQTIKP